MIVLEPRSRDRLTPGDDVRAGALAESIAGPGPVDLAVVAQPVQQPMVQGLPDAGLACQSRSRRQQVTPLPQPSSLAGTSRQGTPARST